MDIKWYQKRAFWLLLVDALAAVAGIVLPLAIGTDAWKIVLAVWTAMQPVVIWIVREFTIEEAAQRTVRDLASRGLLVREEAYRSLHDAAKG